MGVCCSRASGGEAELVEERKIETFRENDTAKDDLEKKAASSATEAPTSSAPLSVELPIEAPKQEADSGQPTNTINTGGESAEEERGRSESSSSMSSTRTMRELVSKKNGVIHHKYKIIKELGRGSYSRVFLAENEHTEQVAVKVVFKKRLKPSELLNMHRETAILAMIHHPHVIRYVEHFEDSSKLYIVTEYLPGGELFDRVVEREYFNEQDVRTVMKVLLETISFCHERNIVHRDIKPENILLGSKDNDADIRLADFGFAKKVDYDKYTMLQTACGTPGYVAPEILTNESYDHRVDIWSLGVVAYILLCGYPPFRKGDRRALFKQIKNADYVFDSPWWDPVSDSAKDFVSMMLKAKPDERASVSQLLEHPFLTDKVDRDITPMLKELKEYNAKRKVSLLRNTWKAAVRFKILGSSRRMMAQAAEDSDDSPQEPLVPASEEDEGHAQQNEEAEKEDEELFDNNGEGDVCSVHTPLTGTPTMPPQTPPGAGTPSSFPDQQLDVDHQSSHENAAGGAQPESAPDQPPQAPSESNAQSESESLKQQQQTKDQVELPSANGQKGSINESSRKEEDEIEVTKTMSLESTTGQQ